MKERRDDGRHEPPAVAAEGVRRALETQSDPDADERSQIRERLRWTPAERLAANASYVAFVRTARPQGPLLRD